MATKIIFENMMYKTHTKVKGKLVPLFVKFC